MGQLGFDFEEDVSATVEIEPCLSVGDTGFAGPARHEIDEDFVLRVARNCDRLQHLKTLDSIQMSALGEAIGIFSAARQAAYRAAVQGKPPNALGWIQRAPDLHRALSVIHMHGIDSCEIPLPVPLEAA